MQESIILDSSKPGRSIFLAPNPWYPLILIQHNDADTVIG